MPDDCEAGQAATLRILIKDSQCKLPVSGQECFSLLVLEKSEEPGLIQIANHAMLVMLWGCRVLILQTRLSKHNHMHLNLE